MDNYYFQYNSLKKSVKRLERDLKFLEIELEDLDKYVNRETVIDLIHKIVPLLLINERKDKDFFYSFEIFKEFDSVEIIKIREKKAIPYK